MLCCAGGCVLSALFCCTFWHIFFFLSFLFRWRLASTLDSLATATSLLKAMGLVLKNHHKTDVAMIGKPRLPRGSGKALKTIPGSGTLYVLRFFETSSWVLIHFLTSQICFCENGQMGYISWPLALHGSDRGCWLLFCLVDSRKCWDTFDVTRTTPC